jgi:hypothetical protein
MINSDDMGPLLLQLDYLEWRLALLEAFIKNKNLNQEAQTFINEVEEYENEETA